MSIAYCPPLSTKQLPIYEKIPVLTNITDTQNMHHRQGAGQQKSKKRLFKKILNSLPLYYNTMKIKLEAQHFKTKYLLFCLKFNKICSFRICRQVNFDLCKIFRLSFKHKASCKISYSYANSSFNNR